MARHPSSVVHFSDTHGLQVTDGMVWMHSLHMFLAQVQDSFTPSHSRKSAVATLAPFRSVGGTTTVMTTKTEIAKPGSSSPFSVGMERELDRFVTSRPRDRYSDGGSNAVVREAQRRAWRRALSEQKRKAAADERKLDALEVCMEF